MTASSPNGLVAMAVAGMERQQKSEERQQKNEEMRQLRQQHKRLQEAGRRRFVADQSSRPRPRRNRIGSAAARRDARALSRMRHSTVRRW